jgi:hypothetical protein
MCGKNNQKFKISAKNQYFFKIISLISLLLTGKADNQTFCFIREL